MTSVIGARRSRFWAENGFLVFPGFFDHDEVAAVQAAYDNTWARPQPWVVVDDLVTNRRTRITDLAEEQRGRRHFKVNDLYLSEPDLRLVALSYRVGAILEELLGDEPVICNTLNFDKGSQQADHLDTLYMTPESHCALVATWMALEDARPESGPLRYYPGSNHIAPFRFSTGSMHVHGPEMPAWSDYMASAVERMGLEEQRFPARTGDLFVWHALLLHGGSEITDPSLTRQSLVTHFFTQTDAEARRMDLRPAPGGWWQRRLPQGIPGGPGSRVELPAGEYRLDAIDIPTLAGPPPMIGSDLHSRMAALTEAD